MTNENELNVGDVALRGLNGLILSFDRRYGSDNQGSNTCMIAINLIKSQQSRIELLESAIHEFNDADKAWCAARTDVGFKILDRYESAKSQLKYLMENKS